MNREPETILKDIILHELGLPLDYGKSKSGHIIPSVYVYAPNIELGNTDKLQIKIESLNSRVVSNANFSKDINGNFTEIQETVLTDSIQIDIFSRNSDARLRRFEVLTALHSVYAQQMQEKHQIRIFQIPNGFRNTNFVEGSARIYRYTFTVNVTHKKQYSKSVDYYDKFPIEASVDNIRNKEVINPL